MDNPYKMHSFFFWNIRNKPSITHILLDTICDFFHFVFENDKLICQYISPMIDLATKADGPRVGVYLKYTH